MQTTEAPTQQQTVAAIIAGREAQRVANSGYLVPSPIPIARFANACLIDPVGDARGRTMPVPNFEMTQAEGWLLKTYKAGGDRRDIFRVCQAIQPVQRAAKFRLRDLVDDLCKEADKRSVEEARQLDEEAQLERFVGLYSTRVAMMEAEERGLRAELAAILAAKESARKELVAAQRKLRERMH